MRRLLFFVIFSLLLSCSAESPRPSSISEMQLEIVHNGTVETPLFRLERLSIELLMPQSTENQVVRFEGDTKRDDIGNSWLFVSARNPPRVFAYREGFLVNSSSIKIDYLPEAYDIPDSLRVYLRSTDSIQAEDPAIQRLSEHLTRDAGTDFEKVCRMAVWVHDNVEYQRSLKNESKDALWVLENRTGTCDEFTTLFLALARSQGIPARFVAGYYFGSGAWEEHAFAEVYLGEWVPVDPTNLDVGGLDAAHLRYAVSKGNVVGSKIIVYGAEAEDIHWSSNTSINILNYSLDNRFDYELSLSSDSLREGDSAVVVLAVKSDEYALLRVDLQPCVSDFPFMEIDSVRRDVVLEPGKEEIVYWGFDVAEELEENMRYECPLVLNSKRLDPGEVVLNVDSQGRRDKVRLAAEVSDPIIHSGGNQTIFLHVDGVEENSPVKVGFVAPGAFQEYEVSSNADLSLSFEPEGLGRQQALVYSSTGLVLPLDYVVKEASGVYIESIRMPQVVLAGEKAEAVVLVRGNGSSQQTFKLAASIGSVEALKSFSVVNLSEVRVPFQVNETGIFRAVFRLKGGNADSAAVRQVRVYDVPSVSAEAYYLPRSKKAVVSIEVSRDYAENLRFSVGNQSIEVGEFYGTESYEFSLEEPLDHLVITYEDASGESYSLHVVAEEKQEGLLESLFDLLNDLMRALLALS